MPTATDFSDVKKVLPRQFHSRFDKLWKSQRRELAKILGAPPDPKRVKESDWARWEKEQRAVLLILMAGYALPQITKAIAELTRRGLATITEAQQRALRRAAMRSIRERADFATKSIRRTSTQRVENGTPPDEVISPQRARTISTTEMTAARSSSIIAMYKSLVDQGIDCQLVWRLRPCMHCQVCPMLDATTYDYWSRFFPNGPPVHPHCCCQLELLFGTYIDLIGRRKIKPGPSVRQMRKALQQSGLK